MNITSEQLFDNARTQNGFTSEPVTEAELRKLWDLVNNEPFAPPTRKRFWLAATAWRSSVVGEGLCSQITPKRLVVFVTN